MLFKSELPLSERWEGGGQTYFVVQQQQTFKLWFEPEFVGCLLGLKLWLQVQFCCRPLGYFQLNMCGNSWGHSLHVTPWIVFKLNCPTSQTLHYTTWNPPLLPSTKGMPAKLFTKVCNQTRRLKSDHCILENKWKLYIKAKEIHSSTYFRCGTANMGLVLACIIHA